MLTDRSYDAINSAAPAASHQTECDSLELEAVDSELGKIYVTVEEVDPIDNEQVAGAAAPTTLESGNQYDVADKEQLELENVENAEFKAPYLSYLSLYKHFLWFGIRAFGGSVPQIALMRGELVIQGKWISPSRFNRVYAVYQILPGPEAAEMACYFGYLSRGRVGAVIGGLGFITPGVFLMMLWAHLYVQYGIDDPRVQASFRAAQNTIAAMIFRAIYQLGDTALNDNVQRTTDSPHSSTVLPTKSFNWHRAFLSVFCFLSSVINLNFFVALVVSGFANAMFRSSRRHSTLAGYALCLSTIFFYVLYIELNGGDAPTSNLIGGNLGTSNSTSFSSLFVLGLIAGLLSFGGAYTTIPFIYAIAVQQGQWLSQRAFLDCVAIVNVSPAPTVSFVTMVGFLGNGVIGSVCMTVGMFLPALSFTAIGHELFEYAIDNEYIQPFLDGISAAVIGLLALTAFQFLGAVVESAVDSVVFFLAFWALFHFSNAGNGASSSGYVQPIVIIIAAIAGQALYRSNNSSF